MIKVKNVTSANAAPVKHGQWILVDENKCRCSCCDIIATIALYPHGEKKYCPNCGAVMKRAKKRTNYQRIKEMNFAEPAEFISDISNSITHDCNSCDGCSLEDIENCDWQEIYNWLGEEVK